MNFNWNEREKGNVIKLTRPVLRELQSQWREITLELANCTCWSHCTWKINDAWENFVCQIECICVCAYVCHCVLAGVGVIVYVFVHSMCMYVCVSFINNNSIFFLLKSFLLQSFFSQLEIQSDGFKREREKMNLLCKVTCEIDERQVKHAPMIIYLIHTRNKRRRSRRKIVITNKQRGRRKITTTILKEINK